MSVPHNYVSYVVVKNVDTVDTDIGDDYNTEM